MKKLTELEKELIGVVLDFEKKHLARTYKIAEAAGLDANCTEGLIPFKRLEEVLRLNGYGDLSVEVIYGYTRGEYSIDAVYEIIEHVLNKNLEGMTEWFDKYEQA